MTSVWISAIYDGSVDRVRRTAERSVSEGECNATDYVRATFFGPRRAAAAEENRVARERERARAAAAVPTGPDGRRRASTCSHTFGRAPERLVGIPPRASGADSDAKPETCA